MGFPICGNTIYVLVDRLNMKPEGVSRRNSNFLAACSVFEQLETGLRLSDRFREILGRSQQNY